MTFVLVGWSESRDNWKMLGTQNFNYHKNGTKRLITLQNNNLSERKVEFEINGQLK